MNDGSGGDYAFTYGVNDKLETITYSNGVTTTVARDVPGQVESVETANAGGALFAACRRNRAEAFVEHVAPAAAGNPVQVASGVWLAQHLDFPKTRCEMSSRTCWPRSALDQQ